jgi:MFS family permease
MGDINVRLSTICAILYTLSHEIGLYASRPYISILVVEYGGSSMSVGLIASSFSIIQVILAIKAGKWIDRVGVRYPALLGSIAFIIGTIGLASTRILLIIVVCSLFLGLSHLLALLSVQNALTGLPDRQRNRALSMYSFSNSVGMFIGPFLGGCIQEKFGIGRGFYLYMLIAPIRLCPHA